jgi:tryptophanyl-tRNA synthetase
MGFINHGRLSRIPTLKNDIREKGFEKELPMSWFVFPVSQCADITAFGANLVPVGEDQLPVIELDREIVRAFNKQYGDILVEPEGVVPGGVAKRLPGIFGVDDKMSKSLDNGIYLSDSPEEVRRKVMQMYTDPDHIRVDDPGKVEGNVVFIYLDVFAPDDPRVAELKAQYQQGGLGDVAVKEYLIEVLENLLAPMRARRTKYEQNPDAVREILRAGSAKANIAANITLQKVRDAIGLNYFK